MYSDGELDESKFVPDYNEEMTPSQSSQDEVWSTNTSSICSMDFLVLDEVRCSSDEVEVPTTAANQSLDTRMEQPVTSKLQPASPECAPYHCPLCGISLSGHVKRHVQRVHLPSFWSGNCVAENPPLAPTAGPGVSHMLSFVGQSEDQNLHKWCQLVNGSLHLMGSWVGVSTLEEMLNFVVEHRLYPNVGNFTEGEIKLMSFYAKNYSSHIPVRFETSPPNHVICLIHWQILCTFLRQFPPEKHHMFRTSRQLCDCSGVSTPDNPVVDSHFHLDQLFARGITSDCTEFLSFPPHLNHFQFLYAVANYVFPKHWSLWQSQIGTSQQVRITFGIHPHLASQTSSDMILDLQRLVTRPECVAIGEIGIDMTTACNCLQPCFRSECRKAILHSQMDLLSDLLVLAKETKKPVVLHCRDFGSGEAAGHVLDLIRMLDMGDHIFHRHCFMGSVSEAQEWTRCLPSVVFGISNKIFENASLQEVIRYVDLSRIVLETDSPYLADRPTTLIAIAEEVGRLKGISLKEVLCATRRNTDRVYER